MNYIDELKLAIYESGLDISDASNIIDDLTAILEYGSAKEFAECVDSINEILASESSAESDQRIGNAMYGTGTMTAVAGDVASIAAIKKALDARSFTKKIRKLEDMKMQYRLAKDTRNEKLIDDEIRELKKNHAEAVKKAKKYGLIGGGAKVGGYLLSSFGSAKYDKGRMKEIKNIYGN